MAPLLAAALLAWLSACAPADAPRTTALESAGVSLELPQGWLHERRGEHHEFFIPDFVESAHPRLAVGRGEGGEGRARAARERNADIFQTGGNKKVSPLGAIMIRGRAALVYEVEQVLHGLAPRQEGGPPPPPVPIRVKRVYAADGSWTATSVVPIALAGKHEAALWGMILSIRPLDAP